MLSRKTQTQSTAVSPKHLAAQLSVFAQRDSSGQVIGLRITHDATSRLRALVPPFDAIKNVRAGQNDAGPQFFIFNFSI